MHKSYLPDLCIHPSILYRNDDPHLVQQDNVCIGHLLLGLIGCFCRPLLMELSQNVFCIHNSHLHGLELDWQVWFDRRSLTAGVMHSMDAGHRSHVPVLTGLTGSLILSMTGETQHHLLPQL